uniref:Uncharacterized protein n=1 Tax=Arundo donax TaxID=35708 RepID=A0A0A9CS86_ARUDO
MLESSISFYSMYLLILHYYIEILHNRKEVMLF